MKRTTTAELLTFMREQQAQQQRLIEAMLEAHTAQANVLQSWLDMFKPSTTPQPSTSPDERDAIRAARELEAWDPLSEAELTTMLKDLPTHG